MIRLTLANDRQRTWCQEIVTQLHYLQAPVDSRCSPVAYLIEHELSDYPIGCLIFGRPESTRCFSGALTYGSQKDVAEGRAHYDRWEIINLARMWLSPRVQRGGRFYDSRWLPGYTDRRGVWRSTLASHVIGAALERVGYDYLCKYPPVFPDEPYEIRVCLSYCDCRIHSGTIYRAADFERARTNERGIDTWFTTKLAPLTNYQDDQIRKLARHNLRGQRLRAQRSSVMQQEVLW